MREYSRSIETLRRDTTANEYEPSEVSLHELDDGVLALSGAGREYLSNHTPDQLGTLVHAYVQAIEHGENALYHVGVRQPIGEGRNAIVYDAHTGSDLAIKEIDLTKTPYADPYYPLKHMDELARVIDAHDSDLRVPHHYGLYAPRSSEYNYLIMEKIEGKRMFEVLNDPTQLPEAYQQQESTIMSAYLLVETMAMQIYTRQGESFNNAMEDWGSQNIMVSLRGRRPLFWIIDQAIHDE